MESVLDYERSVPSTHFRLTDPQNGHAGQTATDFEDPIYSSSYLPITEGEILYTDYKLRMEKMTGKLLY